MAYTIERGFPTDNDLGGANKGKVYRDQNHDLLWGQFASKEPNHGGCNWVKDKIEATGAPVGLVYTFGAGSVVVDGRYYEFTGTQDVTLANNTTNLIWLQITVDGNQRPNGVTILVTDNDPANFPARAVYLGYAVASGGVVTLENLTFTVRSPLGSTGKYTGDGQASQAIYLGYRPKFVTVSADWAAGLTPQGPITPTDYGFQIGIANNSNGVEYPVDAFWGPPSSHYPWYP